MDSNGYCRVSRFFRKHMKSVLLFAYKKLDGISIPWHNNRMERKMGEIKQEDEEQVDEVERKRG